MNDENNIYGILFGCPVLTRNEDCPFKEIDSFSLKEKVIWIEGLTYEEKNGIMKHYWSCSNNRE